VLYLNTLKLVSNPLRGIRGGHMCTFYTGTIKLTRRRWVYRRRLIIIFHYRNVVTRDERALSSRRDTRVKVDAMTRALVPATSWPFIKSSLAPTLQSIQILWSVNSRSYCTDIATRQCPIRVSSSAIERRRLFDMRIVRDWEYLYLKD